MAKRKLILDVDTGTDDAVAIMLAALHPGLELVACTTVNGNREIEHTTENTLRTLDHIGRGDIPVHAGLARPVGRLDFPIPRAARDPGVHFVEMPLAPSRSKASQTQRGRIPDRDLSQCHRRDRSGAGRAIVQHRSALALFPKLVDHVPEVVIMGGGHAVTNVTPSAEFNVWADPEAAALVFAAGFPQTYARAARRHPQGGDQLEQCKTLARFGPAGGGGRGHFRRKAHRRLSRLPASRRPGRRAGT